MRGYPKWFSARLINSAMLVLFVSGVALIPTALHPRLEWDVPWRVSPVARLWVTALHVLFGFFAFALVGALWSIHMRYWWRKNLGRKSGLSLLIAFIVLVVSSLGVLYFGDESLASWSSVLHSGLGLVLFGPYVWHSILAKRWRPPGATR